MMDALLALGSAPQQPDVQCEYCRGYHQADRCPSCGAPRQHPTVHPTAGGRIDAHRLEVLYGYQVVFPAINAFKVVR